MPAPSQPPCLFRGKVNNAIHKILWWMLDIGAPGHILKHGWQKAASFQIGLHPTTLGRHVDQMIHDGYLVKGRRAGEVALNVRIFRKCGQPEFVRMMKWDGKEF